MRAKTETPERKSIPMGSVVHLISTDSLTRSSELCRPGTVVLDVGDGRLRISGVGRDRLVSHVPFKWTRPLTNVLLPFTPVEGIEPFPTSAPMLGWHTSAECGQK